MNRETQPIRSSESAAHLVGFSSIILAVTIPIVPVARPVSPRPRANSNAAHLQAWTQPTPFWKLLLANSSQLSIRSVLEISPLFPSSTVSVVGFCIDADWERTGHLRHEKGPGMRFPKISLDLEPADWVGAGLESSIAVGQSWSKNSLGKLLSRFDGYSMQMGTQSQQFR